MLVSEEITNVKSIGLWIVEVNGKDKCVCLTES